jgi:hypothetical protein
MRKEAILMKEAKQTKFCQLDDRVLQVWRINEKLPGARGKAFYGGSQR